MVLLVLLLVLSPELGYHSLISDWATSGVAEEPGSILERRDYLRNVQIDSEVHPIFCAIGTGGLFPGGKMVSA
jgi:hypothetical protein